MVKGCGKKLTGETNVIYLKNDGTYHVSWQEACARDGAKGDIFSFPDRYCGSDGYIDGKRQHICMECAKSLGVIW